MSLRLVAGRSIEPVVPVGSELSIASHTTLVLFLGRLFWNSILARVKALISPSGEP